MFDRCPTLLRLLVKHGTEEERLAVVDELARTLAAERVVVWELATKVLRCYRYISGALDEFAMQTRVARRLV